MGKPLFQGHLRPARFVRLPEYDDERLVRYVEKHAHEKITISEVIRVATHVFLDKLYESDQDNEAQG